MREGTIMLLLLLTTSVQAHAATALQLTSPVYLYQHGAAPWVALFAARLRNPHDEELCFGCPQGWQLRVEDENGELAGGQGLAGLRLAPHESRSLLLSYSPQLATPPPRALTIAIWQQDRLLASWQADSILAPLDGLALRPAIKAQASLRRRLRRVGAVRLVTVQLQISNPTSEPRLFSPFSLTGLAEGQQWHYHPSGATKRLLLLRPGQRELVSVALQGDAQAALPRGMELRYQDQTLGWVLVQAEASTSP